MSRNLYVGASLDPILAAGSLEELPAGVDEVWDGVVASDPPARMAAIAAEIAAASPDLVAIQEAAAWRAGGAAFDLLALLEAALAARGERYRVAVAGTTFVGSLPGARSGLVEIEDHGAVLAREGVETARPGWTQFATLARIPVVSLELEVPRGFASLVARVDGVAVRLLAAHLELGHEPPLAAVQLAQARELAAVAAAEPLPVVVAGDLNARPGSAAHAALLACGLADAWPAARPADPGHTCCQARGLRNERGALSERIDHLLQRGLAVRGAWRTGADARAAGGRWASDHAGVVADLSAP
jgi:endonuclease/exonuclease/phosphatase family metal-dependent hydrolase